MKKIECNLCGDDHNYPLFSLKSFQVVQCHKCGLVYVNPQPTFEELVEHYRHEFYDQEKEITQSSYGKGSKEIFADIIRRCKTLLPKGNVLDVGCGYGFFLKALEEAEGYQTYGVEPSKSACDYANSKLGLSVTQGTLESVNLPSEHFHIATLNNVVEHFSDPLSNLRLVRKVLLPGGYILIACPNLNFAKPLLWLYHRYKLSLAHTAMGKLALFNVPSHLYFFSPNTISLMLQKAGFKKPAIFNSVPIRNPNKRLWTWSKLTLFRLARLVELGTQGQLLIGPTLLTYAQKPKEG